MFEWAKIGCRNYHARLEGYVTSAEVNLVADPELDAHLRTCSKCRQALDEAMLAGELMRQAGVPVIEPSAAFPTRVMASIREELSRRAMPTAIWRPLELLASKFALGAAAALLVLSVYLAEFAPPFRPPAAAPQTEVDTVIPEPPAQPSNPDEVLMSLIERENDL